MEADKFSTVEELEARLTEIKERLTALDAEYGVRGFAAEAKSEWNDLNEEHDEIVQRLAEIEQRQARLAEVKDKAENKVEGAGTTARSRKAPTFSWDPAEIRSGARDEFDYERKLRDNAKHFSEIDTYPHPDAKREKVVDHVHKLIDRFADVDDGDLAPARTEVARRILATGNPVYRKAFGKYLAGKGMSPEEQRALSVGTGSAGGFALVYTLDPTIVPTSNFSVNPWRALARIETIAGTNEWKAVTSGAITASYTAEATEASDNAPTLAQPDIIVEKAQAYVPFSIEAGQDWTALQDEMAALLQDSKDDLEATKFTTGAGHGSTEPKGVITGATNTTTAGGVGAFAEADVYKLFEALPPRFRPRAQFAANLFTIDKVRQFTTGTGGVPLYVPSIQAQTDSGAAGTVQNSTGVPILGRQIWESTAMAAALTTGSKILLVGDFRYFCIVDRVGMDIEIMPLVVGTNHRPTGQRGLYAYWRNSSDVLSAAAFQVLVTG